MIHFDFIVDEFEADAIFSALHDEIVKCYTMIADGHPKWPEQTEWLRSRIKFLEELKKKMTNSKVQNG